jgi:hypothetical protein
MKNGTKILFACSVIVLITAFAGQSFAKSVLWTDDFTQNQNPTLEQCQAWHDFLDQLSPENEFTSVTMRGSSAPEGITMTDPAAVQELAHLLYTRTDSSVTSDGHTWYVYIGCNLDSCVPGGQGVELRIDYSGGCACMASESFTVRPDIGNDSWGGVNTESCSAPSQTMMVEFSTRSDSDTNSDTNSDTHSDTYSDTYSDTDFNTDFDTDGIADGEDLCPLSDLSQTVIVDGCDSGVYNTLFSDGCTVKDLIDACADNVTNHGQFVSCVSGQLNSFKKEGLISGKEKGAVQKCVAN